MNGSAISGFTPEELAELTEFDAWVDDDQITLEEWMECSARDRELRNGGEEKRKKKKTNPNARQWQIANAERWNEYQTRYRDEHRDELRLYDRIRYAEKREVILSRQKAHRAENRDELNERRRAQRAEDPEAAREREREYRRAHADAINARKRARYQKLKNQKEASTVDATADHPAA